MLLLRTVLSQQSALCCHIAVMQRRRRAPLETCLEALGRVLHVHRTSKGSWFVEQTKSLDRLGSSYPYSRPECQANLNGFLVRGMM